ARREARQGCGRPQRGGRPLSRARKLAQPGTSTGARGFGALVALPTPPRPSVGAAAADSSLPRVPVAPLPVGPQRRRPALAYRSGELLQLLGASGLRVRFSNSRRSSSFLKI